LMRLLQRAETKWRRRDDSVSAVLTCTGWSTNSAF